MDREQELEPLDDKSEERTHSPNYGSTEHEGNGANGKNGTILLEADREYTPSEIIKIIGLELKFKGQKAS